VGVRAAEPAEAAERRRSDAAEISPADDLAPGRARTVLVFVAAVLVLAAAVVAGTCIGSVAIGPGAIANVVEYHLRLTSARPGTGTDAIVWLVRVPRVLLGVVVGAGLAMCGASLQAVVRNPIADPYLLGISSGASVGATLVITLGVLSSLGVYALSAAAFVGALSAAAIVLVLSRSQGSLSPMRIILAGTAIGYACSAISSLLIFKDPRAEAAQTLLFWLLGSLAGATWGNLWLATVVVVAGGVVLWAMGRHLNALQAGEDTAAALGVDVNKLRRRLLVVTTLMAAAMVAVSGAIGFVGLLLPHAARFLAGSDHRRLIPLSAVLGGAFLVLVDIGARTLASPEEIPIGVITALLGTPFFLWALRHAGRRGRGGV